MSVRAVVIGSSGDALVCAHLLGRAGWRVRVIEETAGKKAPDFGWVPPQVVAELSLQLAVQALDPWASVLLPQGDRLDLWRDIGRT